MNENQRLQLHQIVKMSAEGIQTSPISARNGLYGVVVGYSPGDRCIRIRKMGHRSITSWHHSFWDPCPADEIDIALSRDRTEPLLKDIISIGGGVWKDWGRASL